MIIVEEYSGQGVGVFGLGKAGEATLASLIDGGAHVFAWDDGKLDHITKRFGDKLQLVPFSQWPWRKLKALILSPGVPLTHPKPHAVVAMAQEHNCPIIGDIELLYRACPGARYVAITGTNGKSTTTTLIGHILKSAGVNVEIGGNLGTAALTLAPLDAKGTYVLELSSYQLDLLKTARFNVSLLLNVTPDHLDRHGDMPGYVHAKKNIFLRQQKDDVAVIGMDDDYTRVVARQLKEYKQQHIIDISAQAVLGSGVYVKNGVLHDRLGQTALTFDISHIVTLTGKHNWQNAAAAYAVARACGVAPETIYKAMQNFAGLRHRLQLVATVRGVRFINDSKATNADATANALAPYDNIYWIAGGKPKAGGISTLTSYFPKIAHAFLIGEAEAEFAATLKGKAPFTRAGTLKMALKLASDMAFAEGKSNAVVLLSPACASFDQWKNFEERGDAFCVMVEAMNKEEKPAGGEAYAL